MSILIIGSGNVGNALAADLSYRRKSVSIWAAPSHLGYSTQIAEHGLKAMGEIEGTYRPVVKRELAYAVSTSKYIMVTIPSLNGAREELIEQLKVLDLKQKILIWIPGNAASLSLEKLETLASLETTTSPYGCRMVDDAIYVKAIKKQLEITFTTPHPEPSLAKEIGDLFPNNLVWLANGLEVALNCTNCICHTPAVIFNAAKIDIEEDFYFYKEGMTPIVTEAMKAFDQERIELLKKLGFKPRTVLDLLNGWYGKDATTIHDFVSKSVSHNATKGAPKNFKHRYIMEDGRMLILFRDLGKKFGINVKKLEWAVESLNILGEIDLEKIGITLASAGMEEISADDIVTKWGNSKAEE
ncbi:MULTISPECIES: NAD/NADP octopine/nopaline dehydrogenase family protein [Rhizobium]|uniref:NAD/NADP octopine/nopaline dehydrogenase family protein n=1 Tax=Rhizobium rhododendri TaxID=2506430 RepID=A0ABY8IT38_9HYPH|nr:MULTISPECIES: NAD/NADP octopine/nopaline dehydrogenase family protein [Rhizobium]TQX80886.1 D-lysopine dehydrogenase/D-octopine dehydrogenase [Rhizobium sp. rho-13.1]TQY04764.1 D-lysopine dehydrogenase/D-octopine dehydrogenase [Rhizobium sp. rho-1.1]WFS26125.1 NAD/NADP octopine/nopaline dehydrogenase family protein [Rhizobium rhododendri]